MDPGFLNDTNIYYNLAPVSKNKEERRRSTLPRPHSSFICNHPSSCPSSPKLSIFKPKRTDNSTTELQQNLLTKRHSNTNRNEYRPLETSRLSGLLASSYREEIKDKHETPKVLKTSKALEAVYENVTPSSEKSRKKSSFFPWWRRKKQSRDECASAKQNLLKSKSSVAQSTACILEASANTDDNQTSKKSVDDFPLPDNYFILPKRTSSCSSSTTTLSDDDDSESSVLGERILGGVSYVRPTRTSTSEDPCNKDLPNDLCTIASQNEELPDKIGHWVHEWRRKSRWLTRRRREKNPRHSGEGDVDIALLHCDKDTAVWAEYLSNNFLTLLQDKLGRSEVKVEKIKIESFRGYQKVPEVQASRINNAKLQIVILSPGFVSVLDTERELHIGNLLRPNRVLSLLLGVSKETLQKNPIALSSLYSFDEWKCFQVRDRDETFITQVEEESLRILTNCDVFAECKTYAPFSLCPRKITQSYCRLYIHLKSALLKGQEDQIRVTVEQTPSKTCDVTAVQCHNPYTLSFNMPEFFLGISSFLKVNVFVEGRNLGYREVKCEGPLDILNDILRSATNPTELMCQALGISSASNDLDELLSQRVKNKLPLKKHFYDYNTEEQFFTCQELPTWLHFSAFYGLQSFTWALLDVPSVEKALLMKNSKGNTPAKLALQAGYTKLAQDLENLVIVTSLAIRSVSSQQLPNHSKGSRTEDYTIVPSPRPYTTTSYMNLPAYDTPPIPRLLKDGSVRESASAQENLTSTPKGNETIYANLLLSSSPLQFGEEKGEAYLDMSGTNSQLEEYQMDVSILVDAWDKRNDARTFLSEYELTISKLKENFHFKSSNNDVECNQYSIIKEENEESNSKDKSKALGAMSGRYEK